MPGPNNVQQINVGGSVGTGAPTTDSPVFIAGWDATLLRAILTDTSGRIVMVGGAAVGSPVAGNALVFAGEDASGNVRIPLVNVQQQLYVNTEGQKTTYRANAVINATGAGVYVSLTGSGTKTVRVTRVGFSAVSTAANDNIDVELRKYSSALSAGTPASLTTVPLDSSFAGGTATGQSWAGGFPTPGTLVGTVASAGYYAPNTSGMSIAAFIEFTFGEKNGAALVLRGTSQVLGIYLNPSAATYLNAYFEWTEE